MTNEKSYRRIASGSRKSNRKPEKGLSELEMDFRKLIGRIVEKFGTRSAFCNAMDMKPEQLSRRLNNRTPFTTGEILMALELLEIPPKEIGLYFFTPRVR